MTPTSAAGAATKSKTDFEMPVQELASTNYHPLVGSAGPSTANSPSSALYQVAPPSAVSSANEDPKAETVLDDTLKT